MPAADSAVVRRLNDAGAVLVAKLSLGALALNDIWFGGQTMNPWLLEEGASGSSAGPGAATAAGLVGFSIGSETGGSIVAPGDALRRHRPAADVRPRAAHRRDDAVLVARQARADDAQRRRRDARAAGDHRARTRATCRACRATSTSTRRRRSTGLRVGYFPAWMKESPATDVDRAALETVKKLGMAPTEVTLPDWPYSSLMPVLFSEAAAAFEELTLSGGLDTLKVQVPDAWPNLFRQARFLSAVDFVQADRLAPQGRAARWRASSREVDLLLVPSLRDEMLTHLELHRPSVADAARRVRRGVGGAQRLGARSEEPAAEVLAAAARAARRHAARPAVRRRHGGACRPRAGAGVRRGRRAPARLLVARHRGISSGGRTVTNAR